MAETTEISRPDRRIWRIAAPAIVSNTSGALVGIVDTWAIGHLSDPAALAGLAIASFAFAIIYWSMGFLRMGTTGLVAQAFGARSRGRLIRVVVRSLLLALVLGVAILALRLPLIAGAVYIMDVGADVAQYARTYLEIRIWGVPLLFVKLAAIGFLIGTQRAGVAMVLELVLNVMNAVLTAWFVAGLGWGVAGAATASLISESTAGVVGFALVAFYLSPRLMVRAARVRRFWRLAGFRSLLSVNAYLFFRTLFLLAGFGLFLRWAADLGETPLAATHVMLNFVTLAALGLDGIAYAAEALVGEAVGARAPRLIRYWSVRTSLWAFLMSVAYGLVFYIWGREIVAAFTDIEAVRQVAWSGIFYLAILPPIAVWSFQLDGIFIGATAGRAMLWSTAAAMLIFWAAGALVMPEGGFVGLWQVFLLFYVARAAGLLLAYPGLERAVSPGAA